jgi:hypothetical protein
MQEPLRRLINEPSLQWLPTVRHEEATRLCEDAPARHGSYRRKSMSESRAKGLIP